VEKVIDGRVRAVTYHSLIVSIFAFHFRVLREGMSFVNGAPWTLRTQLQDGRSRCHLKDLLGSANQQVGLREMLEEYAWSPLRFRE
jgi:hypothetical protein